MTLAKLAIKVKTVHSGRTTAEEIAFFKSLQCEIINYMTYEPPVNGKGKRATGVTLQSFMDSLIAEIRCIENYINYLNDVFDSEVRQLNNKHYRLSLTNSQGNVEAVIKDEISGETPKRKGQKLREVGVHKDLH